MRKNVRGGRHFSEYWDIEALVDRVTSNKSHPKWGSEVVLEMDESKWSCQVCGTEQTLILPQYLIPLDDTLGDLFKICSVCKHKQIINNIRYIHQLIRLVRL